MNDIIITSKRIKIELVTLLVCFLMGCIANIGAIIYYKSSAIEMLTSLPYVLVFTLVIYVVWGLMRLIKGLFFKTKRD